MNEKISYLFPILGDEIVSSLQSGIDKIQFRFNLFGLNKCETKNYKMNLSISNEDKIVYSMDYNLMENISFNNLRGDYGDAIFTLTVNDIPLIKGNTYYCQLILMKESQQLDSLDTYFYAE